MRKTFLITAILLLSTAWAVAQTSPSSQQPTTPGASSPSSTMPSSQSTTPDASSSTTTTQTTTTSSQTADNSTAIEGCLSGSSGSYTLTDQSGKAWQLAGDTSKLTEHVGHQVRVMGTGADSSASSGGAGSSAASSGAGASGAGSTFTVKKVKMISASCSTSK